MARRVWVKNPRVKGGGYYRRVGGKSSVAAKRKRVARSKSKSFVKGQYGLSKVPGSVVDRLDRNRMNSSALEIRKTRGPHTPKSVVGPMGVFPKMARSKGGFRRKGYGKIHKTNFTPPTSTGRKIAQDRREGQQGNKEALVRQARRQRRKKVSAPSSGAKRMQKQVSKSTGKKHGRKGKAHKKVVKGMKRSSR